MDNGRPARSRSVWRTVTSSLSTLAWGPWGPLHLQANSEVEKLALRSPIAKSVVYSATVVRDVAATPRRRCVSKALSCWICVIA